MGVGLGELEGSSSGPELEVKTLLQRVSASDWAGLKAELESPNAAGLEIAGLVSACKKQDSGAATKAVLKLFKDL